MKEKRLDFELLRILAIFLVVFNHTQSRGYELFLTENCHPISYILSILLSVLCKMGVPLFLMVSGGLLLHRQETLKKVIFGRVLRIAAALVLFSLVVYLFWVRWGYVSQFTVKGFLREFYTTGISAPYWYLYAYAALMLMLPMLRVLAQNMRDSAYMYFTLLFLLYQAVLRSVGYLLFGTAPNSNFDLSLCTRVIYYFMMGYYLTRRFHLESLHWRGIGVMAVISGISVLISCLLLHISAVSDSLGPDIYREGFVALPAITVFLAVCKGVSLHPLRGVGAKVVSVLGGTVFGVYLLEGILRGELGGIYQALEPSIHVLPACFLWVLSVVAAGMAITWLLKKIPLICKLF